MIKTDLVRYVDNLGRVCIPKEVRHKLHITEGDSLEFCIDNDSIVIRKVKNDTYTLIRYDDWFELVAPNGDTTCGHSLDPEAVLEAVGIPFKVITKYDED